MIKVSWIIILASVLQVSAGTNLTYSQTVRLNLKLKNADLEQVIWFMKEQGKNTTASSGTAEVVLFKVYGQASGKG